MAKRPNRSPHALELQALNGLGLPLTISKPLRQIKKWLTDITEFHIRAGKVYLSPIIDSFDGMVISWAIGTKPDAGLANTMLDAALELITDSEVRPIIHSDRGGRYRWPGWLERVNATGIIRSMSRRRVRRTMAHAKGSSADSRPSSSIRVIGAPSLWLGSSTPWMLSSAGIMKRASRCALVAEARSNTVKASAL